MPTINLSSTIINLKKIESANDVPYTHHYAVMIYYEKRIHHEGDERSRTNPGHGYPAHTEVVKLVEHWITTERHEWEQFILKCEAERNRSSYSDKRSFVGLEISCRAKTVTTVIVETK